MNYYCYISQSKVDQLIAEFGEKNPIEWIEDASKKKDKQASGGLSKLITLFNANLSYGRSDVLQTNVKLKMSYVTKLKTVLNKLSSEVTEIETLSNNNFEPGKFYLYRNEFVVSEIDHDQFMACLETTDSKRKLILHCSLYYFSESPVNDGVVKYHSSNYAFFEHKLPVSFETLFLYLSKEGKNLFGSPLYLKLSSQKGLLI